MRTSPTRRWVYTSGALLVVITVAGLLSASWQGTIDRILDNVWWAATGLIASETLFVLGLAVMLSSVGLRLSGNPFRWRQQWKEAAHVAASTRTFWAGFWVNAIGALGTGIVGTSAVVMTLPPAAWGIAALPLLDVALTISVRGAVLSWNETRQDPAVALAAEQARSADSGSSH